MVTLRTTHRTGYNQGDQTEANSNGRLQPHLKHTPHFHYTKKG